MLPVLFARNSRQQILDVAAQIGRHAFQPADSNRLSIQAASPASRLAGTIAGAPEDGGKHVRFAIEQVRIGIPTLRDEAYVFGNVSVSGAGPLAVHDSMEIVGILNVSGLHERAATYLGANRYLGRLLYTYEK